MNNSTNNRRHAHKRPESVYRDPARSSTAAANTKPATAEPEYRFTSGYKRSRAVQRADRTAAVMQKLPPLKGELTLWQRMTRYKNKGLTKREIEIAKAEDRAVSDEFKRRRLESVEREWQEKIVRVNGGVDILFVIFLVALMALGIVTMFSASYPLAVNEGVSATDFVMSQLKNIGLGLVAMFIAYAIKIEWYDKFKLPWIAFFGSIGLVVITAVVGQKVGATQRWLDLGFVKLQPSELMKASIILFLAWYFEYGKKSIGIKHPGRENHYFYGVFLPCMIMYLGAGAVISGRHLSGALIVAVIGCIILFTARCHFGQLMATVAPGLVGGLLYIVTQDYAKERFLGGVAEEKDLLGSFYQNNQSIYAIGNGGVFGVGLGKSIQKHSFLTASHTDFIFSIWCEEFGFIGAVVLISLFILLIWRGFSIAIKAPDTFTCLVAIGITSHIGIQAFFHMMVTANIVTNTGVTLPFFSYGGSSTLVTLAEMGILLNISKRYYRKKQDVEREKLREQLGLD